MVELTDKDWENAKQSAEGMVKQALIMLEVNANLIKIADNNIKKLKKNEDKEVKKMLGV